MVLGLSITKKIKELQKKENLKDLDLAKKLGITVESLRNKKAKLKKGQNIKIESLNALAKALGVEINYFL